MPPGLAWHFRYLLKKYMEEKKTSLQEQNAPVKNTDNAFVKVRRDGSPEMPVKEKQESDKKQEDPKRSG